MRKLALDVYLNDEDLLGRVQGFYNFSMNFLLQQSTDFLIYYPEWMIEDIAEFFLFIGRAFWRLWQSSPPTILFEFVISFFKQDSPIRNPYLRAKLIEIIYNCIVLEKDFSIYLSFDAIPFVQQHLIPSLLMFYVEVESTGARSQFYDKFNIRYHISQILKYLWPRAMYQEQVRHFSVEQDGSYLQFMNLLINDATYLLDESLCKLADIHSIQNEMQDPSFATKPQVNFF